jgi:hypothetical protein
MFDAPREPLKTAARVAARSVFALAVGAALLACTERNEPPATAFAKAEGQLLVRAKSIKWSAPPPGLPPGPKVALLLGNPNASGQYAIRVQLPANYKIPFHSYAKAMDVTVVSGTLYVADSQTFDKKKAFAIRPGDFYHLPALVSEFVFTKDQTVVEIHGEGPYDLKYANAADDPLKGATAPPYSFTAGFTDNDMKSADADATVDLSY